MYGIKIDEELIKIMLKLAKRNSKQLMIIRNKIKEIIQNHHRYKNLRSPLNHLRRVHIDKSFVLIFSINEKNKKVIFEDYDHHDNIYKK